MSGSSVTQDGPLGNQKAAEQGIGLEERRAVNREDINIGGFGWQRAYWERMVGCASRSKSEMFSAAVASGRFGSAERTVRRPRIEVTKMRRREDE